MRNVKVLAFGIFGIFYAKMISAEKTIASQRAITRTAWMAELDKDSKVRVDILHRS